MRLLRILKTVGKVGGISILCLFVAGLIMGFFYGREIKQLMISELNKNLSTKIHVEEFDFSVLRHFPFASFEMKNVMIEEVSSSSVKDTLLYSNHLSLLFNITDVFKKDISVKKVLVSDGSIHIRIDSAGHGNYHFWKKSEDTTGAAVIDLKKIGLKNVVLSYADKKDRQDYDMLARNAELSGKFSGNEFLLQTNANLFVNKLFIHGVNYADHKPVKVSSGLNVNSLTGVYAINQSSITIDGIELKAGGKIINRKPAWDIDLAINAEEADIAKIISVLPSEYSKDLIKYKSKGKLVFSTTIKGTIENKKRPLVTMVYTVKDGSITSGIAKIDKLNFSGTFKNNINNSKSSIDIPSLTASLSGHAIQASVKLDDFPDAFLTLKAKTQLNLKELQPFFQSDTLESLSGDLAMNIAYAGKIKELSDLSPGKMYKIKASGNIDISNVNFKLKKNPLDFKNMSGNFSLHDNDVYVKNFTGNISSSDFQLDGVFRNFISFLLIPGQSGDVQARLNSKLVDLDELLANKSQPASGDTSYILKFNPRLLCELDVKIDKLNFRRFGAENINGLVNLDKQVISGRNLQFNAMAGNVRMDATINASRRDSVKMDYDAKFTKVDITRLFYEMENFDQQTMTDKNVKGKVSADIQFISTWSNDLTLNSKSVRATGEIIVENGELNNFTPIMALGKYIHSADLNHIRFSTIKNNISIANRKITIPNMDINSSAINISGNGVHDFDNNIDYHLRLLLSDIMGKKVRDNSTEFGVVEDDGLGRTKLFLAMRGTVDDPHFSYDKKATGEKLKNDIALEKQNMKVLLKQEFGLFKKEPSVQASKPKKHEEMQIDWSNE